MTSLLPTRDALRGKLQEVFGFADFRPGQAEIIERALAGRDTLAIMPTGSGKSVCYQLPVAMLDGCVVVVSPLIALMKDQVESLPGVLAACSTAINSTLSRDELAERLSGVVNGQYRLVYVAPERLRQWPFLYALRRARIALFVVDEAHCVSLWGHDFRPDYLFIGQALRLVGEPPVLALTATATPAMAEEIGRQFGRSLELVRTGVLRSNLRLEVHHLDDDEAKKRHLLDLGDRLRGCGIVYVNSRERAERLARLLRRNVVSAGFYHAGLPPEERAQSQDRFMTGRTRVMVATTAFGMGIDKPDVRFIIHFNPPPSLESYVQESGRAGRDGSPATCIVLVSPGDKANLTRWRKAERPSIETLRVVYRAIRECAHDGIALIGTDDLLRAALEALGDDAAVNLDETVLRVIVSLLERAELIVRHLDLPRTITLLLGSPERHDGEFAEFIRAARLRPGQWLPLDAQELAARTGIAPPSLETRLLEWQSRGWLSYRASGRELLIELRPPPPATARRIDDLLDALEASQAQRLGDLFAYLSSEGCRHARIARHFGVSPPARCAMCDQCAPDPAGAALRAPARSGDDHQGTSGRARRDPNPIYVVVQCVAGLPFGVGRTGLRRILCGSVDSPIKPHESPWFGALEHWRKSHVEALIEAAVSEGYLTRDDSEYRRLSATPAGFAVPPDPEASAHVLEVGGAPTRIVSS